MSKSKVSEVFRLQRYMLSLTAAWPEYGNSILYELKGFLLYVWTFLLMVTMWMETYNDLQDLEKLTAILYIFVTTVVYLIKHGNVYVHRKTFNRMLNILEDPILISYPNDLDILMAQRIRFSHVFSLSFWGLSFIYLTLTAVYPLFDKTDLPFPFPYDVGNFRVPMYAFQVIGIFLIGSMNSSYDSLTACLMALAGTQLEILGEKIIRVRYPDFVIENRDEDEVSSKVNETVIKNLRECVLQHLTIEQLVRCIDEIFSFGAFIQFVGTAIVICNTLFNCIVVLYFNIVPIGSGQSVMLVLYLVAVTCQVFMYCYFGNDIIFKSRNIGEACYSSKWYNCNSKVGLFLSIIMERSKLPFRVTAFKFSVLCLPAFTSIIRWSYSYFTLLRKLYKNPQV